jgi:hypothetical protein
MASIDLTTSLPISLRLRQRLLRQRLHGGFDGALGLVGLGLEFLLQQRCEIASLRR